MVASCHMTPRYTVMVGDLNSGSAFTVELRGEGGIWQSAGGALKDVCRLLCIFVAFNFNQGESSSSFQTQTRTHSLEGESFRSIRTRQPLSSLSHHYSSFTLLYGYDCSFVSVGCFPNCGFVFCCPHCLPFSSRGPHTQVPTHTHTSTHSSLFYCGDSRHM